MNRDALLVALGVGVGALISTEQGRNIMTSLAKTPLAQAIGEGAVNLFRNANESNNAISNTNNQAKQEPDVEQATQQGAQ